MSTLHKFKNNCIGTVQNNPLASGGTNLIVDNSLDSRLSALGFNFWLTLWHIGTTPDTDPLMEIVEVTARPSPNNYTIVRAAQNTTAQQFAQNSNVGLLFTAGNFSEVLDSADAVAKGTLIVYGDDFLPHLLPVGSNGLSLLADSTVATIGVKWGVPPTTTTYKNGTTTHNANSNTATVIAHGLGVSPQNVKLSALYAGGAISNNAFAVYNGTTQSSVSIYGTTPNRGFSADFRLSIDSQSSAFYITGVITVDATNITITWTNTGGALSSALYQIMWEAEA